MTTIIDENLNVELEAQDEDTEEVATLEHGAIILKLSIVLGSYVLTNKLGYVFPPQTTFKLRGKQKEREPDLAFVAAERLPQNWRKEADFAPDLAIEVISLSDREFNIEAKVLQYQKSGVRLVWIMHPFSRTVSVYRLQNGLVAELIGPDAELSGEDVVKGFTLKVSEIFKDIPVVNDEDDLAE